jgi:hypothetical protein
LRVVLGLIAGALIILSGFAHSLLGGKDIAAQLLSANVPADLALGLKVGWHFGGVSMLVFGLIVIWLFNQRRIGRTVPMLPALIIGLAYLAFGCYALAVSDFNPFFSVFIIPGVLLVFAARRDPA